MKARRVWLTISALAAAALVVILFHVVGATGRDVVDALLGAPLWMLAALTFLTGANKLIGAAKWGAAARWLAPDARAPRFWRRVELTAIGSLFGQLAPVQLANAAVRWLEARGRGEGGDAVGATLYEQVFDLIALIAFGACGAAILWLAPSAPVALALLAATAAVSLAAFGFGCRVAAVLCRRVGDRIGGAPFLDRAGEAFARAAAAPFPVSARLFAWSSLRVAATAGRLVVAVIVFAPAASPLLAAAGYPLAGLALAAPIFPAGIGLAEWTLSGLLVLAGAAASAAAVTAVAFRLANLASLIVVLALLAGARLARRLMA